MASDNLTGLSDPTILNKIDKLRELNIGAIVALPQLVVVGDQSSGKSSLLESLTGFSFPQAPGLCTRYATQITCRRDPHASVTISIIPRSNADEALKSRLARAKSTFTSIDNEMLAKVFQNANLAMGIRTVDNNENHASDAFSEDMLKIEITGPQQEHLTVIDVPGIFRVPDPPLTTENDVVLVKNMVMSYMANSSTIILAVIPSNVDVATQEIIKFAEKVDPDGIRTMGVLTKPDLVTEKVNRDTVIDLVVGRRRGLALGYYVVKNRGADDQNSSMSERISHEKAFFASPEWGAVLKAGRCGIPALKTNLRDLLADISNKKFPIVKTNVQMQLLQRSKQLDSMGPSRLDLNSQKLYLVKLASKFQQITQLAKKGYYSGDEIFARRSDMKLITTIVKLNEAFANVFLLKGHSRCFPSRKGANNDGEQPFASSDDTLWVDLTSEPDLDGIISTTNYECPKPSKNKSIMDYIRKVYHSDRGPELGTFGGSILNSTFQKQSKKWEPLVIDHTSKAIVLVHTFILKLLNEICSEGSVVENLLNDLLIDKLRVSYQQAMDHAKFLLRIEKGSMPFTVNHYFNANLQKKRNERVTHNLEEVKVKNSENKYWITMDDVKKVAIDKDNAEQVCDDILDTLLSYYKVARKRFVDVICQHVVSYFLLEGQESPLHIFTPELIMSLSNEQIEKIAGEGAHGKRQRATLEREIKSLKEAMNVLRK